MGRGLYKKHLKEKQDRIEFELRACTRFPRFPEPPSKVFERAEREGRI